LVFTELEAAAEFENRFLHPPHEVPGATTRLMAFDPDLIPKPRIRGDIPRDAPISVFEVVVRSAYAADGADIRRVWERGERGGWLMTSSEIL
jgi:hypothetical protein